MKKTPDILQEDLAYIFERFSNKEALKGARVLITGCAGFLGFSFMHFFARYVQELSLESIIGLDNFLLGKPDWLTSLENSHRKHLTVQNFDIAKGDLSSVKGARQANVIIHMASIASPTFYRKYPIETIDANVWGLRRLLDFYKKKRLRGFLFFSSSETYGSPDNAHIPTKEDYRGNTSAIGPRACYDEAKRFGETLCFVYANRFSLPTTIVRPFNNYGPGMHIEDKRVPADFAKAVLRGRDIVIHSDGSPTRTFCYVADALVGYLQALTLGKFDYFNIGIEKPEISILQLAKFYQHAGKELLGYKGSITLAPSREKDYLTHNPSRRCPDIGKAQKLLDYHPSIEVKQGVERFLRFLS